MELQFHFKIIFKKSLELGSNFLTSFQHYLEKLNALGE